jgi:hypothetical protein
MVTATRPTNRTMAAATTPKKAASLNPTMVEVGVVGLALT